MGNFNTVMEILAALGNAAVHRLRSVWDSIDPRLMDKYNELETLMGSARNHARYRSYLKCRTGPVLPYLGIYLKDCVFINEGKSHSQFFLIFFSYKTSKNQWNSQFGVLRDIGQHII
jgi:hypothetical protein